MSEAVEGAELILYGVSEKYKERCAVSTVSLMYGNCGPSTLALTTNASCSANCRLELNYGCSAEVDMVPLLMQQGYKPKGWLGLILGTRMYYQFFAAAVNTDEKFMQQMDALTREIGERGQVKAKVEARVVSEGVPPAPTMEPEPAPAPAPASPPHSTALAPVEQGLTPSMQMMSMQRSAESSTLVERLLDEAKADRAEAKADRAAIEARFEARLAQQRQEMEMTITKLTAPAPAAISDEQVASLQNRFEALHTAKLLTVEELHALEDLAADFVELNSSVADVITRQMVYSSPGDAFSAATKLHKLVGLSTTMASDAAFARQVRRKFL
eukprot:COSAG02_NODE_3373_length_6852_cov_3.840071_1_plen_328_part_00